MKDFVSANKGKIEVFMVFAILLTISLLTHFRKDLFVEESGKIELFNGLSLMLIFGLIFKWKYTREILAFWTFFGALAALTGMMVGGQFSLAWFFLVLGFSVSFYFLSFSKNVRQYLTLKR
ncbi:MAG: hypothetical protein IPG18_16700 [Saprospiraceae bacterium]|nr:hypothetical protein [Saprospiraceae bacterium]